MRLNLSLLRLHEDFYATWQKSGSHRRELMWQTDIPLIVDGNPVGRLCVYGLQSEESASSEISQFIDFVETLESQLAILIQRDLAELTTISDVDEDSPDPAPDSAMSNVAG